MTSPDMLSVSALNLLLVVAGQHGADVPVLRQAIGYAPAGQYSQYRRERACGFARTFSRVCYGVE